MKYILKLTIILLLIIFFSCKNNENDTRFCMNRISQNTILLSSTDYNTVKLLFETNELNYNNLRFYKYVDSDRQEVRCNQYINNLQIFTYDLTFHFSGNIYQNISGDLTDNIILDTKSTMNQDAVVEIYIKKLIDDESFIISKDEIINNCMDLEFGYYDLNVSISFSEKNFVKAWKVKPQSMDYPVAYINDSLTNIIYYDNGIRYK